MIEFRAKTNAKINFLYIVSELEISNFSPFINVEVLILIQYQDIVKSALSNSIPKELKNPVNLLLIHTL